MSYPPVQLFEEPDNTLDHLIRQERKEMRDFIFNEYDNGAIYIRNNAPPGIGKSHLTVELVETHPEDNFVIVIPDHDMATGTDNLEDMLDRKNISYLHIYGKSQPHIIYNRYCLQPKGQEYFPGCSFKFRIHDLENISNNLLTHYNFNIENETANCKYRNHCPYKMQFRHLDDYQVIICVIEHAKMFDDRIMIFDESFEQKLLSSQIVSNSDLKKYRITLMHKEFISTNGVERKFYNKVITENIPITDEKSYFLSRFFQSVENMHAYEIKRNYKGKEYTFYKIFGKRIDYMPENYLRIIFNCATTPTSLMCKITETEFWEWDWRIYNSERFNVRKLSNPVIKFKHNWGVNLSTNWLEKVTQYMKDLKIENSLIVTKKAIEEEITEKFPDCRFVHFNAGRGFNSMDKGNKVIIQYGRFGFDPLTKVLWNKIGFTDDLIKQMELSEMYQCLHRGRPLLHPDIPIIMMSDKDMLDYSITVSPKVFELFHQFYDIDLTLSNKEIAKKIGVTRSKIYPFKSFVEFVRTHIYKIN